MAAENTAAAVSGRPASPARATPVLVPQGPLAGRPDVPLNRAVTLVGSADAARLHLTSRTVSKAHALFVVHSTNRAYVADLASRTGVIVNGRAVREATLKDGDLVQIGKFPFRFRAATVSSTDPDEFVPADADDALPAAVSVPGKPLTTIDGRLAIVGRRTNNDVDLPDDPAASSAHAALFQLNGQWLLRDLGSRTGTKVNGRPVAQQIVGFGDRVTIGGTTFLFQAAPTPEPAADEPTAAPPPPAPVADVVPAAGVADPAVLGHLGLAAGSAAAAFTAGPAATYHADAAAPPPLPPADPFDFDPIPLELDEATPPAVSDRASDVEPLPYEPLAAEPESPPASLPAVAATSPSSESIADPFDSDPIPFELDEATPPAVIVPVSDVEPLPYEPLAVEPELPPASIPAVAATSPSAESIADPFDFEPLPLDAAADGPFAAADASGTAEVVAATEPTPEAALDLAGFDDGTAEFTAALTAAEPADVALSDTTFGREFEAFADVGAGPLVEPDPVAGVAPEIESPSSDPMAPAATVPSEAVADAEADEFVFVPEAEPADVVPDVLFWGDTDPLDELAEATAANADPLPTPSADVAEPAPVDPEPAPEPVVVPDAEFVLADEPALPLAAAESSGAETPATFDSGAAAEPVAGPAVLPDAEFVLADEPVAEPVAPGPWATPDHDPTPADDSHGEAEFNGTVAGPIEPIAAAAGEPADGSPFGVEPTRVAAGAGGELPDPAPTPTADEPEPFAAAVAAGPAGVPDEAVTTTTAVAESTAAAYAEATGTVVEDVSLDLHDDAAIRAEDAGGAGNVGGAGDAATAASAAAYAEASGVATLDAADPAGEPPVALDGADAAPSPPDAAYAEAGGTIADEPPAAVAELSTEPTSTEPTSADDSADEPVGAGVVVNTGDAPVGEPLEPADAFTPVADFAAVRDAALSAAAADVAADAIAGGVGDLIVADPATTTLAGSVDVGAATATVVGAEPAEPAHDVSSLADGRVAAAVGAESAIGFELVDDDATGIAGFDDLDGLDFGDVDPIAGPVADVPPAVVDVPPPPVVDAPARPPVAGDVAVPAEPPRFEETVLEPPATVEPAAAGAVELPDATVAVATDRAAVGQVPPPPPMAPAAAARPAAGPSLFGFDFEGGSFLGGMPLALDGPPAALPAAGIVFDSAKPPAGQDRVIARPADEPRPPAPVPAADPRPVPEPAVEAIAPVPQPVARGVEPVARATESASEQRVASPAPTPARRQPPVPQPQRMVMPPRPNMGGRRSAPPADGGIPPPRPRPAGPPVPGGPAVAAVAATSGFAAAAAAGGVGAPNRPRSPRSSSDVFSQVNRPIGVEVFGATPTGRAAAAAAEQARFADPAPDVSRSRPAPPVAPPPVAPAEPEADESTSAPPPPADAAEPATRPVPPPAFGAPRPVAGRGAAGPARPPAQAVAPTSFRRRSRVPALLALLVALVAGTCAAVYLAFPPTTRVVGSLPFEGLAQKGQETLVRFEREQQERLVGPVIRKAVADRVPGVPAAATGAFFDALTAATPDGPVQVQWLPADAPSRLQLAYVTGDAGAGRRLVAATLDALRVNDLNLNDTRSAYQHEVDQARDAVRLAEAEVAKAIEAKQVTDRRADDRPAPDSVQAAKDDAANARRAADAYAAEAARISAALDQVRTRDTDGRVDVDADPKLASLRAELDQINAAIEQAKAVGPGVTPGATGTTRPAAGGDNAMVALLRGRAAAKLREIDDRRADLAAQATATPEQRQQAKDAAVKALSAQLAQVQTRQAKAADDARSTGKRADDLRKQVDDANTAAFQRAAQAGEVERLREVVQQRAKEQGDRELTAASAAAPAGGDHGELPVTVDRAADNRPMLYLFGSGLWVLILGVPLLLGLRRPGGGGGAGFAVAAPRPVVAWPSAAQLSSLDAPPQAVAAQESTGGL